MEVGLSDVELSTDQDCEEVKSWEVNRDPTLNYRGGSQGGTESAFLGFGPVMHMPPEHCHSCTLHSEMVTKSNSNSCVCLDAVSSSTYVHFVDVGDERFQFIHLLESSHVTLQWLINTQLKWQLECFLHLFDWVFVDFFLKDVCLLGMFVCLWFVMDGHSVDWPQLFQEFNPEIWIPIHWSIHDLTPGFIIALFLREVRMASEGWCTSTQR